MKVGIFDPYLDTLSGGEKYMLSIASCLAKKNEVSIFWDQDTEEIRKEAKRKLDVDLTGVNFTNNIFKASYPRLKRLMQSKNYDLIVFLSDGSIPFVWPKLIVHFQFPVEWVKIGLGSRFKIGRVNKIICNSLFTKSFIDRKFGISSTVLYPPVEIKGTKRDKGNIILHVGRFGKDLEGKNFKKQDVMINAFKKLNAKPWEFVLVIGRRKDQAKEIDKLRKMARGYSIKIVENPNNQELWKLYNKAKIYWHASGFGENLKANPEKSEHFGISTVEAMGAGAVPVVINAGGQKEIVEDGKSGFLWDSIEDLIKKTNTLIENQKLWQEMSREAYQRSKKFSGDRFCTELDEIIE